MGTNEKFCLRWNDFESNVSVAFKEIREEKDFFDCTLSVGDRQIQAHKLILSACSPFFRSVLRKNPHQHPLLYLKGVEFSDLQSVLNFMYHGEVNVAQEELNSFLAVAEDLKVKGLTQNGSSGETKSHPKHSSRPIDAPPRPSTSPDQNFHSSQPETKRPRATPQYTNQQDDDEIQVMPVVKTEPVVVEQQPEPQQPTISTYQQSVGQTTSYSGPQGQVTGPGGTLTQVEDQTVYGEDDGYDYGGYEEGYEGANDGDVNKGQSPDFRLPCGLCNKYFTRKLDYGRHMKTDHGKLAPSQCHVCLKNFKTKVLLREHLRLCAGIIKHVKIKN